MKPYEIEVGLSVEYSPAPEVWFPASVASTAWLRGDGQWVVDLTDLPSEYAAGQCNVSAAPLWCLRRQKNK